MNPKDDTTPPKHLETSQPHTKHGDAYDPPEIEETFITNLSEQTPVSEEQTIAQQSDKASALPKEFGRYRIIQLLGTGAMGAVYLAEDTQLQRQVALKIPSITGNNPDLLKRFYREARSAATLNNKHICTIFDVGEIDGTHYISMAYIEGKPLSEFINPQQLQAPRQVTILIRKLALALQEAHEAGVVHRDLKPDNIMVDTKGEPVIMDFGLARQTNLADVRMTQSGAIMGTPAYMSPEQVRGEQDVIGPLSDQYSLGVVLYEMVCGKRPFSGSLGVMMSEILTKVPETLMSIQPEIEPVLEAICLKMIQKEQTDRYDSMSDVADALGRYIKIPGASVSKTSFTNFDHPFQQRSGESLIEEVELNEFPVLQTEMEVDPDKKVKKIKIAGNKKKSQKLIYGMGILLLGPLLLFIVIFLIPDVKGTIIVKLKEGVPDSIKVELARDGTIYIAEKKNNWTVNVTEGKYFVHLTTENDLYQLSRKELSLFRDQTEYLSLSVKPENVRNPTVNQPPGTTTPPEHSIPTVSRPVTILGRPGRVALYQHHRKSIDAVAFSSDGKLVAAASRDGFVSLWGFPSGKFLLDIEVKKLIPTAIEFSRNGKNILIGYSTGEIRICNTETGKVIHSFDEGNHRISRVAYSPDERLVVSAPTEGTYRIWNVETGEIQSHTPDLQGGDIAFLSNEQLILSLPDKTSILKAKTALVDRSFHAKAFLRNFALSPNKKLIVVSNSETIQLWDVASGKKVNEFLQDHHQKMSGFKQIAFFPDGKHIVAITYSRMVYFWNVKTAKDVLHIELNATEPASLAVGPKGRFVMIGSQREQKKNNDGEWVDYDRCDLHFIRLPKEFHISQSPPPHQLMKKQLHSSFGGHSMHGISVAISPNSKFGVTTGYDHQAFIWDLMTTRKVKTIQLGSMGLDGQFSADGEHVITFEKSGRVKNWKAFGVGMHEITPRGYLPYTRLFATPDGKHFVMGGYGYWFRMQDAKTGKVKFENKITEKFREKKVAVDGFALSRDGQFFASGGTSRVVKVWDLKTGKLSFSLKGAAGTVRTTAFSQDGKYLFAAGGDKLSHPHEFIITMWDLKTGKLIQTFEGHRGTVFSLGVFPGGKRIISASEIDRNPFVWETKTGKKLGEIPYPGSKLLRFALSPDGKKLLTRDGNKNVFCIHLTGKTD